MKLVLAALLVVGLPALACDDGSPVTTLVGLLDKDRALVREERFEGSTIRLYVVDLAKNKVTEFATILGPADAEADRPKLRAQRWKTAEAQLKKQGLALQTVAEQKLPLELKGVTLKTEEETDEKSGCSTVKLVAVGTKGSQKLDSTKYCGASDTTSYRGVFVIPGERFIVPMLSSGCLDEPTRWMKAIPVASFAK